MTRSKNYDKQFKDDAVRLLISSGKKLREVAAELGVERSNLGRWKREYLVKLDGCTGVNVSMEMKPSEMEKEIRSLRKELNYVKEQRDILKKAISIFSRDGSSHMSL